MPTQRKELEVEALLLSDADRSALARRLIESLEPSDASDSEAEWIEEAELRYARYRKNLLPSRPSDSVFREASSRLD